MNNYYDIGTKFLANFNNIAFWILAVVCVVAAVLIVINKKIEFFKSKELNQKQVCFWFFLILIIGALVRILELGGLPAGLNQDEASIAYESYALSHFGVDRNGYALPVFPLTWGAGQSPFYVYFAMPFIALFGNTIFAYRIGNALLSVVALVCVYKAMKIHTNARTGLIAMFLFAISPWNIFLSRWALDANQLPSMMVISLAAFFYAINTKKTQHYIAASILLAITLYTYSASYVVVPLFLLLTIPYIMAHRRLTWKQLLICGGTMAVIAAPLLAFLLINMLDLEEVKTAFFSIPKLSALRSSTVFRTFDNFAMELKDSWKDYVAIVFEQTPDNLWNSVKDYGIIYMFSLPVMLMGIFVTIFKTRFKTFSFEYLLISLFIATTVYTLMVNANVNRIHIMFIPLLLTMAVGINYIYEHLGDFAHIVIAIYAVGFILFSFYLFNEYNNDLGSNFKDSYEQAVISIDKNFPEGKVYTPDIGGNYCHVLYFAEENPNDFYNTVQYMSQDAEFRVVMSFDRYTFSMPANIDESSGYIVPNTQLGSFPTDKFNIETFKYYSAVWPK